MSDTFSLFLSTASCLYGVFHIFRAVRQYQKDTEEINRSINELRDKLWKLERLNSRKDP